jgi:hypothetical protein
MKSPSVSSKVAVTYLALIKVAARALDLAVDGTIGLWKTGTMETFTERAQELENTSSSEHLSQPMSLSRGGESDNPAQPTVRMAEKQPVAATASLYS